LLAQTQSLRHRPHMSDLFQSAGLEASAPRPLADRLRPQFIGDVVGQDHLIGDDGPIGRMLSAGRMASMILWGPPGVDADWRNDGESQL